VSYGAGIAVLGGIMAVMLFLAFVAVMVLAIGVIVVAVVTWLLVVARSARATLVWSSAFLVAVWCLLVFQVPRSGLFWAGLAALLLWSATGLTRSNVLRRRARRARQQSTLLQRSLYPVPEWRPYQGSLLDD
jgi:hypothetical protein